MIVMGLVLTPERPPVQARRAPPVLEIALHPEGAPEPHRTVLVGTPRELATFVLAELVALPTRVDVVALRGLRGAAMTVHGPAGQWHLWAQRGAPTVNQLQFFHQVQRRLMRVRAPTAGGPRVQP